jgi:hypothetical protein
LGVDATLRAPDRKPLGNSENIQRALVQAFPGVRFTYHTYYRKQTFLEALTNLLPGAIERALNRQGVKGCYGDFEAEGSTAQFSFALEQPTQIDVQLYGSGTVFNPRFSQLTDLTGWKLTYD